MFNIIRLFAIAPYAFFIVENANLQEFTFLRVI
jgi:hypothetical protein